MSNGLQFKLQAGGGGTVIDPDGPASAVKALHETYGDRLDWHGLQEAFEERAANTERSGAERPTGAPSCGAFLNEDNNA